MMKSVQIARSHPVVKGVDSSLHGIIGKTVDHSSEL